MCPRASLEEYQPRYQVLETQRHKKLGSGEASQCTGEVPALTCEGATGSAKELQDPADPNRRLNDHYVYLAQTLPRTKLVWSKDRHTTCRGIRVKLANGPDELSSPSVSLCTANVSSDHVTNGHEELQ
jgi:hypothetical protein